MDEYWGWRRLRVLGAGGLVKVNELVCLAEIEKFKNIKN